MDKNNIPNWEDLKETRNQGSLASFFNNGRKGGPKDRR